MSNDYLNPFGTSNISNTSSATTVGSVSVADNPSASIMTNSSSSTMNYILSSSDLKGLKPLEELGFLSEVLNN